MWPSRSQVLTPTFFYDSDQVWLKPIGQEIFDQGVRANRFSETSIISASHLLSLIKFLCPIGIEIYVPTVKGTLIRKFYAFGLYSPGGF